MIKIGCCGFGVQKKIYFKNLSLVEIQQTFYQPPKIETAKRWRDEAPSDLEFTLKAWQLITHEPSSPTYRRLRIRINEEKRRNYGFFKETEEVEAAWNTTKDFAKALGANKIVFQCPASFIPSEKSIKNLNSFFKRVKRENFIFIWEPRGQWNIDVIERICKDLNIYPCFDPFEGKIPHGDFIYLRLHGKKGYRYKYSEEDLIKIREVIEPYSQSYILFNNIYMYEDSLKLKNLLKKDRYYKNRFL